MDSNNLTVTTVTPAILPVLNTISDIPSIQGNKHSYDYNNRSVCSLYAGMDNNNLTDTTVTPEILPVSDISSQGRKRSYDHSSLNFSNYSMDNNNLTSTVISDLNPRTAIDQGNYFQLARYGYHYKIYYR